MREKILALLVAKFQGVRKDVLNHLARAMALQAATEEEAKALVDKVTDAQVAEYVKETRADVDKEVSESNKTFEANLRKKFDFVDRKAEPEPGGGGGKPADPNDIKAAIRAAVDEAVRPLHDKLQGYESRSISESRLAALNEKLNACKDKSFKEQTLKDFARMAFKDDEEFNAYLNEKVTDIETANQNAANNALGNGSGSPLFSQKEDSGISKGVAAFIESQKPEKSAFSGKEV